MRLRALLHRYGLSSGSGEWLTQYTDTATSQSEAETWLESWRVQHGFRGGRVLPPSPSKPGWRLQVFTEDVGAGAALPDGQRRVFVLRSQFTTMGIR